MDASEKLEVICGIGGNGFIEMSLVEAVLVPHVFVAVTLSVPPVAELLKLTETKLPDGLSVAPVPE